MLPDVVATNYPFLDIIYHKLSLGEKIKFSQVSQGFYKIACDNRLQLILNSNLNLLASMKRSSRLEMRPISEKNHFTYENSSNSALVEGSTLYSKYYYSFSLDFKQSPVSVCMKGLPMSPTLRNFTINFHLLDFKVGESTIKKSVNFSFYDSGLSSLCPPDFQEQILTALQALANDTGARIEAISKSNIHCLTSMILEPKELEESREFSCNKWGMISTDGNDDDSTFSLYQEKISDGTESYPVVMWRVNDFPKKVSGEQLFCYAVISKTAELYNKSLGIAIDFQSDT